MIREVFFMKIGGFQLRDSLPECYETYAFATLRPWIDINNVGSLVLKELANRYEAREMGKLSKPGEFYDFTRYRPTIHLEDGIRDMIVPNTTIRYADRDHQKGLLLLRLLEPHARAELYVDSVVKVLKTFKVKKYILLGGMYDTVPHTRPLLVSGYGMGKDSPVELKKIGALPITYYGPSSITNLITKKAARAGIETIVLIVSIPQYVVLGEDHMGKVRLMEILNTLYDIPVDTDEFEKARVQKNFITSKVSSSPEVKTILPQLESAYDMRMKTMETEGTPYLSPEMEAIFWKTMGKDIGKA